MTHEHEGVCECDDKSKKCTCSDHSKETSTQVAHCGSEDGDCHCHDDAPKEHEEEVVAEHSHHSHHEPSFKEHLESYSKLIITFVVVIVFGVVLSLIIGFSWLSVIDYWMGGYFLAFGIMQALSLKKSAAMLRHYEPLSMRFKAYSYAYPFIQIGLGLAYFFMLWSIPINIISLIFLIITLSGVYKVIQEKQTVRCGCLGTSINVPVGHVTLWENLIMIGMVFMMLTIHVFGYLLVTGGADTTTMPGMNM